MNKVKLFGREIVNKLLIKLAKNAGAQWYYGDFNMGTGIQFGEEDLEKFVNQIIYECIIAAERARMRNGPQSEYNKGVNAVVESIQNNFGIEK